MKRHLVVCACTPFREAVEASYDPAREFIRCTNYRIDLKLVKYKRKMSKNNGWPRFGRLRRVAFGPIPHGLSQLHAYYEK